MLSQEENELLTRVGPGTPAGELLRQYWLPCLLSSELPERDGRPLRVRLLGEDLIAFRDTGGEVGLLADHCAHRGASLFFGRNEEGGLRCVYHGWKYDVAGNCVDMPNEPGAVGAQGLAPLQNKIHHRAYPCRELNGMIWTYMGPRSQPPGFPELGPATVPESQLTVRAFVRECNWVQALEGDIDAAHSSYLHSPLKREELGSNRNHMDRFTGWHPRFEVVDTDYGVAVAALREIDAGSYAWNIAQFLMPIFTMFPTYGAEGENTEAAPGHFWIPIDDENTLVWFYAWHPSRPLTLGEPFASRSRDTGSPAFTAREAYLPATTAPAGAWRYTANKRNDYLLEYEAQKERRFSGLPTVTLQDQAMTESMGSVANRASEHLGSTDAGIIRMRLRLINAAKALRDHGVAPPGVDDPAVYRGVRPAVGVLPKDVPWREGARPWLSTLTSTGRQ